MWNLIKALTALAVMGQHLWVGEIECRPRYQTCVIEVSLLPWRPGNLQGAPDSTATASGCRCRGAVRVLVSIGQAKGKAAAMTLLGSERGSQPSSSKSAIHPPARRRPTCPLPPTISCLDLSVMSEGLAAEPDLDARVGRFNSPGPGLAQQRQWIGNAGQQVSRSLAPPPRRCNHPVAGHPPCLSQGS